MSERVPQPSDACPERIGRVAATCPLIPGEMQRIERLF